MKARLLSVAVIAVLFSSVVIPAQDLTPEGDKKRGSESKRLVSLLPGSEVVAVFESRLFFDESLPKLLAADSTAIGSLLAKFFEINRETGIDFREFDQIVVGITSRRVSVTEVDYDPVAIASGNISSFKTLVGPTLKETYSEERINGHKVYFRSATARPQKRDKNSKMTAFVEKSLRSLTKDLAVAEIDKNTLVFGSRSRVRETLEASSRINNDLASILPNDRTAVISFAARTSPELLRLLPLKDNDFGGTLASIKFLSGSVRVATRGVNVSIWAKIETFERTRTLLSTIGALRMLARSVYSGSKRVDQQVYERLIRTARVESEDLELTLELLMPHTDVKILIDRIK